MLCGIVFQPGKNDKSLVSAIIGVLPALRGPGIEEFSNESVGAEVRNIAFKNARTLKFRKTFKFRAGKATKEVYDVLSVGGNCGPKKGTCEGRAGGYGCQILLQQCVHVRPIRIIAEVAQEIKKYPRNRRSASTYAEKVRIYIRPIRSRITTRSSTSPRPPLG